MRHLNCILAAVMVMAAVSCKESKVLDVLEANRVTASFFVIGQNINEESAQMMRRAHDMGCDIENHTFTHTALNSETPEQMLDEIGRTSGLVEGIVGESPAFYRPPYISTSEEMFRTIPMPAICGQGCDDWIPELKKLGFRFVTVPELFKLRKVKPLDGKMYTNVKDQNSSSKAAIVEHDCELKTLCVLTQRP